ncbi:MAG: FapA family protein [Bacillota bacterium]|nr:FapA family protein [Bacillota bacterium]
MKNQDFLSEKEVAELRREIETLAAGNDQEQSTKSAVIPETLQDENGADFGAGLTPLSIEDNGSYVKIDDDNMNAFLYLMPPGDERDNYTMEELIGFLQKNGVTTGYHHSNLAAMIKKRVYRREIVAARGQAAVEGRDGYFDYKFDPDQYRAPKVLADGRVDYTNMSTLQNVRKGDVVAVYHHVMPGQDGFDVKGKPILAGRVKEIPPLRGQAVSNQEDPDVYLATKSGKIEFKDGRIDIQNLHEINGDVTLITGKVEFFGDVVINGNVESGVVIRAGRNIEIKGTVEAVNLFAGGDIILSRGIQGGQKAKVSARGNIFADFIEHTVVMAGGSVQANTILNSRISADDKVILTGKKGAIIGGYTHATKGITATEIGNAAEMRTVVHAGCEKEIYQRAQDARKREPELIRQLKDIAEEMEGVRRQRASAAGKSVEILEGKFKALEKKSQIPKAELLELRKECQELENAISQGQGAEIEVSGNIYRGTVICFAQVQMPIEHSTCFMKYFWQRGLIESSVIAYS